MEKSALEFLRNLVDTPSITGSEAPAMKVFADYLKNYADLHQDAYGNTWAIYNASGNPKVMLEGHADQLGFYVFHVDDKGYIYVQPAGGHDRFILAGSRVVIHTPKGDVPGVFGSIAIHMQTPEQRAKRDVPKWEELYIDIGSFSKEETLSRINLGDPIRIDSKFTVLKNDLCIGAGMDNLVGVWNAAQTLKSIATSKTKPNCCIIAAASIMEEVGCFGGQMNTQNIKPDVGICVDVTHAVDTPGIVAEKYGSVKLGAGPSLGYGYVNHRPMIDRFRKVAAAKKIPYQLEIASPFAGTDAIPMFKSGKTTPTVSLGIPNRYMHTPIEMISLNDLDNMSKLCAAFCMDIKKGEKFSIEVTKDCKLL